MLNLKHIFTLSLLSLVAGNVAIFSTPPSSQNSSLALAEPYNTFDGPGFPACNAVSQVYRPSTVAEMISLVKNASVNGIPVRASGVSSSL